MNIGSGKAYQFLKLEKGLVVLILTLLQFLMSCTSASNDIVVTGKWRVSKFLMGTETSGFLLRADSLVNLNEENIVGAILGIYDNSVVKTDITLSKNGSYIITKNDKLVLKGTWNTSPDSSLVLISADTLLNFRITASHEDSLILFLDRYQNWNDLSITLNRVE